LSDLFAGRQAVRHHAEGEDRLDDDGDDRRGMAGRVRRYGKRRAMRSSSSSLVIGMLTVAFACQR
jgi:hypothetical protein